MAKAPGAVDSDGCFKPQGMAAAPIVVHPQYYDLSTARHQAAMIGPDHCLRCGDTGIEAWDAIFVLRSTAAFRGKTL
jgi:hypothetical protein